MEIRQQYESDRQDDEELIERELRESISDLDYENVGKCVSSKEIRF